MRILMLSAPLDIQGPLPKIIPLLIDGLRGLGCDVVYAPWGRHSDREALLAKISGRGKDLLHARSLLLDQDFDAFVIHTSHEWPALLRDVPLLVTTRQARPATVLQFHGSRPERLLSSGFNLYKSLSVRLIEESDAILLLSTEERRQWQQLYPAANFHVVSNPFVGEMLRHSKPPVLPWQIEDDVPVLLFVGRLIPEKGVFDLLEAVACLSQTAKFHVLIAGSGGQEQEVRARVKNLGLADHVTMTGYVEGGDLAAAYQRAMALVLPTYWPEGFPTVISEAMSFGLPIVTTGIRGVVDHLQGGVNAIFVPPRDPVSLAYALAQLLADPELREQMSRANKERIKRFAPEVVSKHYLEVLEEVVAVRQDPRLR